jgi:hypothetical protein
MIKGPPALLYHPGFMVGLVRGGSSSMVPKPRFWVQLPPVTHFLLLRVIILTYLAVSLSTHMTEALGRDLGSGTMLEDPPQPVQL